LLLKDRPFLLNLALFGVTVVIIMYFL